MSRPENNLRRQYFQYFVLVCASILGYVVITKTFWFHDDWYFLANAAGMTELDKNWSRWFSYEGYWKLLYPIFGLETFGWGVTRLLLHAGSTFLVVRICEGLRLKTATSLYAGLIFACSPVVFESLYWGTGAVELMGTFFTLASFERWLRGTRSGVILAVVFGILAVGSKETGLFLPFIYSLQLAADRRFGRLNLFAVSILWIAAVLAIYLIATDLKGSTEYSLSLNSIPRNFLLLGFWLIAPPPFQTGNETGSSLALVIGAVFWLAWLFFALLSYRRGNRKAMFALLVCMLSMAPALPLGSHIVPRYNYGPAAAAAISISLLLNQQLELLSKKWIYFSALIVTLATWGNTNYRINSTYQNSRPIHRLVLKEEISRNICENLATLNLPPNDKVVFLIEPTADELDVIIVQESLGGVLGPQLVFGNSASVTWESALTQKDAGAYVISVLGLKMQPMGYYRPKK